MKNRRKDDRRFKAPFLLVLSKCAAGRLKNDEFGTRIYQEMIEPELRNAQLAGDFHAFDNIRSRVDRCLREIAEAIQRAHEQALNDFDLVFEARQPQWFGIHHHLTNTGEILRAWQEGRIKPAGRL